MKYVTAWDAVKYAAGVRGVTPSGEGGPVVGMSYVWMWFVVGLAVGVTVGKYVL